MLETEIARLTRVGRRTARPPECTQLFRRNGLPITEQRSKRMLKIRASCPRILSEHCIVYAMERVTLKI